MQKQPFSQPVKGLVETALPRFIACRKPLLDWFKREARDLPWRLPLKKTSAATTAGSPEPSFPGKGASFPRRSPYAVWISEIMLQQTQVSAVVSHFERWMARFPTIIALANAPEEAVLQAWAGLGYYARARNLHKGAKVLAAREIWPVTGEEWRTIPGVGAYTSGAIASIAFGLREPILDGNVVRVFSRLLGLGFLPGESASASRAYWDLARLWADADAPEKLNEAVMELGALVCSPRVPRCDRCPLSADCTARQRGWRNTLPPLKQRAKPEVVAAVALVATLQTAKATGPGSRVLVEERVRGAFLAGHEMFPLFLSEDAAAWRTAFGRRFPGWKIGAAQPMGRVRHAIMSKRYDVEVWRATLTREPRVRSTKVNPEMNSERWLPAQTAASLLTNSLARKIWAMGEKSEIRD